MFMRLIILAVTPAVAIIFGVYLTDRYDKEPPSLLIKVFIFGALTTIPAIIIERFLQSYNIYIGFYGALYTSFIVAGLTEESLKRLVVVHTAFRNPNFNEKLDGIVYCVFSALGFATVENIMYIFSNYTNNYSLAIMRGIFSVPGHAMFGVTMGYYLSLAAFTSSKPLHKYYMVMSLLIPVTLHGTFNTILMTGTGHGMTVFVVYTLLLWGLSLRRLNTYRIESRAATNLYMPKFKFR